MSVKASVASMALSGCPEAGALRCRPELADRNLDAPQLQKLEEIVERAEEASLVQTGRPLAVGWATKVSYNRTITGLQRWQYWFKQLPADAGSGHMGMLMHKAGTNRSSNPPGERDYFAWGRCVRGGAVRYDFEGALKIDLETIKGLPCRFSGEENDPQAAEMWRALKDSEYDVLAMGGNVNANNETDFKEVYVAVRLPNDGGIKAYEFDLSAPAEVHGQQCMKVREVIYEEEPPQGATSDRVGGFYDHEH